MLDDALACSVFVAAKKIARAVKQALRPDGITVLQNNEPAGGQELLSKGDIIHTVCIIGFIYRAMPLNVLLQRHKHLIINGTVFPFGQQLHLAR